MNDYNYDQIKKCFTINDYDRAKPFASFLPSIAGERGIPLWCYYVNRGQGVASFGIRDKDGSILEFYPANNSYRLVDKYGFRTFIKINGKVTECFSPKYLNTKRSFSVYDYAFQIEEENTEAGYKISVMYYGLPNENIGALVRRVKITNIKDEKQTFEVLDGLSQLLPSGVGEWSLKHQSNLVKSWFDAKKISNNLSFYFLNSLPGDEAEVKESDAGNYYFSSSDGKDYGVIFDANVIFGSDTTLNLPLEFMDKSLKEISLKRQVAENKVSIGFTSSEKELGSNETLSINTLIGYAANEEMIKRHEKDFKDNGYLEKKYLEASAVIDVLLKDIDVETSNPLFDQYLKQSYLDNLLRGGYPKIIKTKDKNYVYHLFSRRHGDLEREYNFFSIAPEFYSQGNGNFRDVCQNRRSDNLFNKDVEISNAKVFASLIQLDGYNPLKVEGAYFIINDLSHLDEYVDKVFKNGHEEMKKILSTSFTPGIIFNAMEKYGIESKLDDMDLLSYLLSLSRQETHASFGEGYWVDHWTYILDLVENALAIYPEKEKEYLFDDIDYRYFESSVFVNPRSEKYVLNNKGIPSQYGSIIENDAIKNEALKLDDYPWAKEEDGKIINVSLYTKLLSLAIIKFDTLDYEGIGIEMDANKPGWNDAMNGLPGVFGSGVSETIELARLVKFLIEKEENEKILIPDQIKDLLLKTKDILDLNFEPNQRFNYLTTLREDYREKIRTSRVSLKEISLREYKDLLVSMKMVLDDAILRGFKMGNGIIPTFLVRKATDFNIEKDGNSSTPILSIKSFKTRALPSFLEAPARAFKYVNDKEVLKNMYEKIKESDLYDKKLKIYKTSCDLEKEGYDIGRIRAFRKGWLERESDFTHMTFKYLLGLLKAEMYKEYYEEIKTNFTCFMNPKVYGRSPLENSSFIAPTNNPDPDCWGEGFVSRLTGANAEILSMYQIMFFGEKPFRYDNELILEFKPVLNKEMFKENNELDATFLGKIKVIYHNPNRLSLYEETAKIKMIELIGDHKATIKDSIIKGELAKRVRNLEFKEIHLYY